MKAKLLLAFFILFLTVGCLFSRTIKGYVEEIEGHPVLRVKGTFEERGYAQGYLFGENVRDLMINYVLSSVYYNNANLYNQGRTFFVNNFEIDPKYYNESQGVIEGMNDSGVDLFVPVLNRDMDRIDLLMNCSIVDLIQAYSNRLNFTGACSSISSWGNSTLGLPGIEGEQIITRHLDWSNNYTLRNNQLITVHFPVEEGYQSWINIGFPGFISALSAVNESRLGVFYNVGSNHAYSQEEPFQPVLFALRDAIESADLNEDGTNNHLDVQEALQSGNFLSGSIIYTASLIDEDSFPVVFEVNNTNGVAVRTVADNYLNPSVPDDHLVATNHFRTLYNPSYCYRYQRVADSLAVSTEMTQERSWNLLSGAAGISSNLQAMQYVPVTGELRWAKTLLPSNPAHSQIPAVFDIDYLLTFDENQLSIDEELFSVENIVSIQNYPNPFNPETTVTFTLERESPVQLKFFNLRGQVVHRVHYETLTAGSYEYIWDTSLQKELSSGIYFLKLETGYSENYHKMILMK